MAGSLLVPAVVKASGAKTAPSASPPPRSIFLLDRGRVSTIIAAAGLNAILLASPTSVYHATSVWPALSRMGRTGTAFALTPQDRRAPIAFLCIQFAHYYTMADIGLAEGVRPFHVTRPESAAAPDRAAPASVFATYTAGDVPPREARRGAAPQPGSKILAPASALIRSKRWILSPPACRTPAESRPTTFPAIYVFTKLRPKSR